MMNKTMLALAFLSFLLPITTHASTVQLPATNQSACYTAAGATVSCGGTLQDGDTRTGMPWPPFRFADNHDGTVTDSLTGLVWLQNAGCIDPSTWSQALSRANALASGQCGLADGSLAGDWRLPNVGELESVVDISVDISDFGPALTSRALFTNALANTWYWTSTSAQGGTENAWQVSLSGSIGFGGKGNLEQVWPVRGGSGGLVRLPVTGQTGCFDASGGSIGCAGTGQDGDKRAGEAWPSPRFTNVDGTTPIEGGVVADQLTGLIWSRDGDAPGPATCLPHTTKDWQGCLDYVKCLNANGYLGFTDWRLPNERELLSRLNRGQQDNSSWLTGQGFINAQPEIYWSSSTGMADPYASAFPVFLSGGYMFGETKSGETRDHWAWPVRGGLFGNADLAVAPETLSFGTVGVGSSASLDLTISNAATAGAAPLAINTIALAGTDAAQFSVNVFGGSSPCGSFTPLIAAEGNCTVTVTYTPGSAGAKTAVLNVSGSDADRPGAAVALTGTGGDAVSPPTIKVTPSASPNGTISPATTQTYARNATASFTVTPAANYHASVTGCGGTLSGTSYGVPALTADCTVSAVFAIDTFTVTPSAGTHGTIDPAAPQTVPYGSTARFRLTPDPNYHSSVTGCGGTLSGNVYTTAPITGDCTVTASFPIDTNTVTVVFLGGTGSTSPGSPQTPGFGSPVLFTVTPAVDYHILSATGCGGILTGSSYQTAAVTGNCEIDITLERNTSFPVTFTAGSNGTLSGSTTQVVNANGSTAAVTAVPNYGYHFVSWQGPGGFTSTGATLVVSNVNATSTYSAVFGANPVKARIDGIPTAYYALNDAFLAITAPGSTGLIQALTGICAESIVMSNPVTIVLRGGYDSTFSARSADSRTVVTGGMSLRRGTLRVDQVVVR